MIETRAYMIARRKYESAMVANAEKELENIRAEPRCFFCGRRQRHVIWLSTTRFTDTNKRICNICCSALRRMHTYQGVKFNHLKIDKFVLAVFMARRLEKGIFFDRL